MEQINLAALFEQGAVIFPDREVEAADRRWYEHPASKGVFLKDLVTGKETGGKFSYHLVRVDKTCEVADHDHETQWEYNMILSGTGTFLLGDKEVAIKPGQSFATPPKNHHTVSAGNEELSLLAIFVPALV
ncbi:MAG: cupin domain-containing protein [Methanoregula sp.]|jgi:quercetin dioxygenase-like cupin family protein